MKPPPILTTVLLHLLIITTVTATTLSTDITALKSIKSSITPTTIPSYSCLSTWNFTSDPCSTPHITHFLCGLSCSANRVTHLTFDRPGYSGTLSPLISTLTHLITIDLSENHLTGPIPSSLFTLPYLITLNLRSNSFSGSLPPIIPNLPKIETFDLSHNILSGSVPDLSNSATLTRLDLSFNKFTGPIPKLPRNLIELAVKNNLVTGGLDEKSFTELTQVEVVELSENMLTGVIPNWFFLLPSIQQINLANNAFTRVEILKQGESGGNGKSDGNGKSNLVAIDIGYNKIEGELTAGFTELSSLTSLSLRYNKLRGPIPEEYSKTTTLRRLFLDGNYLTGMPPKGLFSGKSAVSGSLGDNCLKMCPTSSQLCVTSQKPLSICQRAYGGKGRLKS